MERAKEASRQELLEVISGFDFGGELEEVGIFWKTVILTRLTVRYFPQIPERKNFILQKMNHQIFKDPVALWKISAESPPG